MPFDIQFELDGSGVLVTATGEVSLEEVRETFNAVWKRPDSSKLCYHIVYVRSESRFSVGFDGARDLGMMIPETLHHNPEVRNAIVAEHPRMMAIVRTALLVSRVWARNAHVRPFSDLSSARAWICTEYPDMKSVLPQT